MAFAAIASAASLGIGYAVKQAADFQSSLNSFRAVSGATAKQMGQVSDLAKRLGADITLPATSASDAADAMLELNKAGLSVKNTMAAAKGVLQLSAAAEVGNAESAKIAANALNAFHLNGSQAVKVADLLAASANASSGEMTDMAYALTQTAATAAQAHVSISDTVTAISEMANKGIMGTQAGSSLQQMLLKLESPAKKGADAMKKLGVSVYDAHGAMLPLPSLIGQFTKATAGMSDAQRNAAMNAIFGSRAIRAANIVLLGGTQAFDRMSTAVNRQGAAAKLAQAKMQGLHGAMQALESAAQTLAITVGTPLLNFLAEGARKAAGFVDWINQLAEKMGKVHGFSAKFDVAKDAIQTAIANAVAQVDWGAVWARAQGIGEGLAARFRSINWSAIGSAIGDGIAGAMAVAISGGGKILSAFNGIFRSIDWNALGRAAGPGLATALLSALAALTNPSFWVKNWDLILAVGLTVFGGAVGKIAGKLGLLLARPFADAIPTVSRALGDGLQTVALAIERRSPRLASAFLSGMLKLPGAVDGLLSSVAGKVSSQFGKMNRLARFTIKVLGIDAAINGIVQFAQTVKSWIDKIVHWFEGLPGKIVGALGHVSLTGIGESIMHGLLGGLESGFEKVKGFLGHVTSMIPHIKGPEEKDRKLLVQNGLAIMAGLQAGLQAGWGSNQTFLSKMAGRINASMTRLQAQLDADQQRSEDASNRKALADAETALATAKKKGKGLAAAELGVQQALQQIRDTADQRELTKLQTQHDRILTKIQALKDKAAAKLQQLQSVASDAFDDLANRIQTAFQAKNDAWVSPAQALIDQITRGDQQAQLEKAVTDAQQGVADAMTNGGDILGAQLQLQQAQHDLQINGQGGLADQAAAQMKAHQQTVDAQQDTLNKMLANLRTNLVEQGATWASGMSSILDIISGFGGGFMAMGAVAG